ncbi:MAG TPA: hypothetical protein VM287_05615 [Egibacteraceae bacterium]|nr:hypothetical protein [Egibacteraceae bacterium]
MNVEKHRQRWRVVWRDAAKNKQREPFATEREALMFKALAEVNTPELARRFVRGQVDSSALIFPTTPQEVPKTAAASPTSAAAAPAATAPVWLGSQVLFKPYARAHIAQKTGVTGRTEADELRMLENHIFPYWCADDLTLTDFRQSEKDRNRPGLRTGPDGQPLCISNWIKWLEKREGLGPRAPQRQSAVGQDHPQPARSAVRDPAVRGGRSRPAAGPQPVRQDQAAEGAARGAGVPRAAPVQITSGPPSASALNTSTLMYTRPRGRRLRPSRTRD